MKGAAHILSAMSLLLCALPWTAAAQLRAVEFVRGFSSPVAFVADPSDPSTFYVVEQRGTIRIVRNGAVLPTPLLDLSTVVLFSGERGLLGLAFPPDAPTSRRFFVNFVDRSNNTVVARFTRDAEGRVIDGSRLDLMWPGNVRYIQQPPPPNFSNHKGGHLAFGPDGYLYIGMGDGGSGGDPGHRAQDPATLLGKMLRIDVDVPDDNIRGYRIPDDNPFVDGQPIAALGEIWAFGMRNPWRFNFDDWRLGGTGALVIGDVGQNRVEEVNWEPQGRGGRNYGWRLKEGLTAYDVSRPAAYLPLTDPIHQYDRSGGASITGGFVYRGADLDPRFNGRYFFADFIVGRVYTIGLALDARQEATAVDLLEITNLLGGSSELGQISSFGVDAAGELYLVSYSQGRVLKIVNELQQVRHLRLISSESLP